MKWKLKLTPCLTLTVLFVALLLDIESINFPSRKKHNNLPNLFNGPNWDECNVNLVLWPEHAQLVVLKTNQLWGSAQSKTGC